MAKKQGILLREAEIVSDFFCESSRRTRRGDLGSGGLVGLRLGLGDPEALPAQEDIYTERETKNEKTSLEVTERKHLIHGPVKLKNGWHRKKRHLFLFSDALLISNSRYKKIFKVEHIIPVQNLWMDKVEEGHNSAKKSFYLGWPMENFRATFPSSEQKEKWHSFLERNISLIKEKDHQKSVELQIFTKDIQHSPVAVTASSTDTVNDIIKKTLSMLGISGCEKEYLLSFISGKEEAPFTLIGHEYPYTIKMNHLRYKVSMPQGPRKLTSRTLQDSFQKQMSPDLEGYFFFSQSTHPKAKPTTDKTRCLFMNCISHRHSRSCHNIFWEAPPPARTGLHVRTSPTGVDADKLGVDDYNSESGVLITHSALDFVSEDETLTPLGRLEKYSASEDVLNRQIVAQNLLNTLREVSDNKRHCITVWEIITQLADDPEPIVRAELMEQVPQIALFCQDNQTFITNAFSKYLLSVLIRYLSDQNSVVWRKSQETLMALLEEELTERFDLETKVCPVLMELTAPDSDEFVKAEVLPIMCKMVPMVGKYITKCFILPRFCEMCCDYGMFHIRKVCAGNFGDICSVVGQQATEEMLLPRFFQLCSDNEWGVCKACAECFTAVSNATSQEIRWDKLSAIFVDLISDPSHRVRQAAFQSLGPFISTFFNLSRSGQYFEGESNPSEDVSEDKYSIGDQDIPKYGQIRPEAVPLNLSITNSSFKLGNALEDGAAEICQNCTSEINIPVDSSLLCTLSSESNQEASSNEKDGNLNNNQSALQPKVGTSPQDYTLLGKKLPNSLNFWKTLSFEIDLAEEFEQDSGKSLSPERSEEAPEVTMPGSPNINMTTRNELEKLTENLEPHIDGTDVKAQVEELSAVLHASSLDAYEETFRMEERHELQEDVGINELPNSNVNLDDSVPLISDADENKDTTAHYVHSDADVNTISDLNPEEERRPKVQDVVPQALLDQYLPMTDPSLAEMVDTEIVKHCAYSLPGVALTLGRRNWHCLRETYKILASNTRYEVRRTLAFSIHMLAIILGDELTDADLVPIFNGFLKDVDEVRIGVLKHLYDFLHLLHIDKRREYLYELQEFLVTDNSINWCFRAELAKQLIFLLQLYSPRDIYEYLCPIALHLCADKVSSVRSVSYKLVSKIVMKLHRETPVTFGIDFLNELVENFGRCPKWSGWQAFVFMCQTIIEDDCLPMDQFAVYLMPHLLTLVNDKIPNVRVLLAKTLRQTLHEKECFLASGSCHEEAVEQAIMTLQMDQDSDVKYFASKHPASSKISKDVMSTASSTY